MGGRGKVSGYILGQGEGLRCEPGGVKTPWGQAVSGYGHAGRAEAHSLQVELYLIYISEIN